MAAFTWRGPSAAQQHVLDLGPLLALIQPLVDQLDIEAIIDRHLPPDPQQEFSTAKCCPSLQDNPSKGAEYGASETLSRRPRSGLVVFEKCLTLYTGDLSYKCF
jgi:hypothetical protein